MRSMNPPLVSTRILRAALAIAPALLLGAAPAGAASLRARVAFDAAAVRVTETPAGARVSLDGLRTAGSAEGPEVPVSEHLFYVPDGWDVGRVTVTAVQEVPVAEGLRLAATGSADPDAEARPLPRAALSAAARTYPAEAGVSTGGGNLGGFRLHAVTLFPVRVDVAAGTVVAATALDVELELVPPAPGSGDVVRRRPSPRADATIRAALAGRLENPEDLPASGSLPASSGAFAPEELPSIDGSAVDMVILTSAALATDFQPLADWKTRKGVPTVVRTLDWIDANYPAGLDRAERIRNFIRDAYEKWGTYLVLVGGDHSVVPARIAFNRYLSGGEDVLTDQYYSCLDGDWNGDGDDVFGEGIRGFDLGDNADLYPDVFVGRAPVETATEVATFIAKSFTYGRTPPAGYVESHGGLAEVLFPPDWEFGDPTGNIQLDGKIVLRDTVDTYLPAGWSRSLRYQSDNDESRTIGLAELGAGHHVFSVIGHGDAFKFSAGNGVNPFIQTDDTDLLNNGDRLMVYISVACNPNEIDLESQGESLMNNPSGGAVIVLGSSRADFPIASSAQQAEAMRLAFENGVTSFGAMSQLARLPYAGTAQTELTSERWTILTKLLLGDPELCIWTQEPGNLTVSHTASVALGTADFTVTVTDSLAVPVAGAMVCASDGNGTYSRALTDAAGQAVLPLTSTATGTVDVVVSAPDFRPHEGTLTLTQPAGSHLAATALTVDDDGSGASSGNGDGTIDAGETLEYGVTVFNGGFQTASSAQVAAAVEAGSSATFDLLYGGVADPARIFIGPGRVNPVSVPFTLDFAAPSIDYIGRPTFTLVPEDRTGGGPAGDEGIFLWQDREGWHLVWGGGPDSVTVSGTVTTDGRVRRAGTLQLETADSFSLSAGSDTLTFSGLTDAADVADGLDFRLADSTMVTVTTPVAALGAIASLGSGNGTVVLDIASAARAGQVAYVDLTFTAAAGGPWTDEGTLVFAGPELEAYVLTVDDGAVPPVSGNGNGVAEIGETVRLTPTVINRGTGAAEAVTGSVTAASGITFVDATDSYGAIGSLAESAGSDGYVFTVDDGTGTSVDLTLTDSLGRMWAKNIDFVAPVAPDSVWFTSDQSNIRVAWTIPDSVASPDVVGYNVYRSATQGSGHVKQNFELLRSGAVFIDEDLPFGSFYFYLVTAVDASGNEGPAGPELQAWTTQPQLGGWPKATQGFVYPAVTIADADRSGEGEVYVGSHDFDFHSWDAQGSVRPGFPVSTSFEIWGAASAADLDQDGDDELVFGSRDSRFYGIHHDGTPLWGASPVLVDLPGAGEGIRSAATIADVDNDGLPEILFGTDFGTVYAFNHDGTGLTDSTGLFFSTNPLNLTSSVWGTIAVADLDNNGSKEIAFASWNDSLYVVDATGAVRPGFPRAATNDFRGGVCAGDLDNDGTLELIAGNFDGGLYVFNHDGSDYVPGAILIDVGFKIGAGVALANVDADPELELFFGNLEGGDLYAINHDGTSLLAGTGGMFANLPVGAGLNDGISATPIVVDVDGDSDFEIFVGHRNKNFYGFHHDGTTVPGTPIPTNDLIFSTAAAADLDGDGDIEIAFASYDATVNVLDFSGPYSQAAIEWGTYGGNNGRTATYGDLGPAVDVPSVVAEAPATLALEQNSPNPFPSGTTIRYTVPAERIARLKVFNISGRLVRTLVEGRVPAGRNEVRWDGRDTRGRALASGIYFFRLDDGERTVTRKAVLLR